MTRVTPCGKVVVDVYIHEHEERCTDCLKIERNRYKNALVDLRENPSTDPALKLWADNILCKSNE